MRNLIYFLLLPLLFYPLYFLAVNIVDSIMGDQQLINWLYFDSKHKLLFTFINDWKSSLPVMYGVYLILVKPLHFLSSKLFFGSFWLEYILAIIIVVLASYLFGFREISLVANSFAIVIILFFVNISEYIYKSIRR
jgi:hypothetical protein